MNSSPSSPSRAWPLIALAAFVAVGAIPAGVLLMTGAEMLPQSLLADTPFSTYFFPGLVLTTVIGGSALVAANAHARRRPLAPLASLTAGILLTSWIVIQVAWLGYISALQPLMGAVGLAQILGAAMAWRRRPRADVAVAERAKAFLAYPRIAVIGLSTQPQAFSRAVSTALKAHGHQVVPIHPTATEIDGDRAWPRLSDMPDPPRAALLMVPRIHALAAVEDALQAGVEALWFHRGAGADGSGDPRAVERALEADRLVVDGVCPFMYLEPGHWLHGGHRWMRERELEAEGSPMGVPAQHLGHPAHAAARAPVTSP